MRCHAAAVRWPVLLAIGLWVTFGVCSVTAAQIGPAPTWDRAPGNTEVRGAMPCCPEDAYVTGELLVDFFEGTPPCELCCPFELTCPVLLSCGLQEVHLEVEKSGPQVILHWSPTCDNWAEEYAIYEGPIGEFETRSVVACSDTGLRFEEKAPTSFPGTYLLVVPRFELREGSYGTDSSGNDRPPAASPCVPTHAPEQCP